MEPFKSVEGPALKLLAFMWKTLVDIHLLCDDEK